MSLFNRPAWAKPQGATELDESEENIFRHSARSYREIVEEQERRKREKVERKKVKEERRSSGKRAVKEEPSAEGSFKRRRITLEDGEALLNSVGLPSASAPGMNSESGVVVDLDDDGPVRRSPRINRHINVESPRKEVRPTQIVDLGDSDNDADEEITYEAPAAAAITVQDDSDDDFAELARRARLERQRKGLQQNKSATRDMAAPSLSPGAGAVDSGQRTLPTPPPDPTIQLFISSPIPNTNPLIVHRKLSQRIREIREVWCEKQKFPEELRKRVFFIHCMRRIYDVTTCRSLGLEVDSFGNVTMKGVEGKEGVERVHLEAVTEDIFEEMKAEKARESKRRSGELPPEEPAEAGAEEEEGAAQPGGQDSNIRILLKAKGKSDFKLKVKPTTLISRIIAAYRKNEHLNDSQPVSLEFDGDRLNPDDELQNTEVSDMDCLHVHINT